MLPNLNGSVSVKVVLIFRETGSEYSCKWCYTSGIYSADTVFEAAGGKDTFQTAWKIARPNAVVAVVAMYEEPQVLPLPDMYGKNLVFKTGGVDGSYCREIMDLTACGKLDSSFLITHRCGLDDIMDAYDVFENKKDHVIKYAVRP